MTFLRFVSSKYVKHVVEVEINSKRQLVEPDKRGFKNKRVFMPALDFRERQLQKRQNFGEEWRLAHVNRSEDYSRPNRINNGQSVCR